VAETVPSLTLRVTISRRRARTTAKPICRRPGIADIGKTKNHML